MLGPLPRIHTVVIAVASVLVFVLIGVWLARRTPFLLPPWGTILGAGAGLLVAFLLVHDPDRGHARRRVSTRR